MVCTNLPTAPGQREEQPVGSVSSLRCGDGFQSPGESAVGQALQSEIRKIHFQYHNIEQFHRQKSRAGEKSMFGDKSHNGDLFPEWVGLGYVREGVREPAGVTGKVPYLDEGVGIVWLKIL